MLTPKGDYKDVERGWLFQEGHAAAKSHRQELKLRLLTGLRHQELFIRSFIETVAWGEIKRDDLIQLPATHEKAFANQIIDQIAVAPDVLEAQRQKLEAQLWRECAWLLKARHIGGSTGLAAVPCDGTKCEGEYDISHPAGLSGNLLAQVRVGNEVEESHPKRVGASSGSLVFWQQTANVPITNLVDLARRLAD